MSTLADPPSPNERRALLQLFGLAIAIRAVYLLEYAVLPFWQGPMYDSLVYLRQAAAVTEGRFGDASLLAMSPLYGYFVAALGSSAFFVALAQSLLGLATMGLLYVLARRRVGYPHALVAPLLHLGYGLFLFFESKLLSETLGLALAALGLVLTDTAIRRERPAFSFAAGAVFGLAVLARASLLLVLPFLALAELVPAGRRVARFAGFALGATLVLAVNGGFNQLNTGSFVAVIMVSSTAATTTHRAWDGTLHASDGSDRPPAAWDVVDQAEARLRGEAPPARFRGIDVIGLVRGTPPKLARLFSDLERGFDYPYYGERTLVRTFGLLPVSFGALLVLGAMGLFACFRNRTSASAAPLLAYIVGVVALVVVFHPSSRYRLPMAIPLVLLASEASAFVAGLGLRRRRVVTTLLAAVCLLFSVRLYTYRLEHPESLELLLAESFASAGDAIAASHHEARARAILAARQRAP